MIKIYRIEIFDIKTRKYVLAWQGRNFERAEIMFNKPYIRRYSHRMIKIEEEILYKEKADKWLKN